MTKMLTRSSTRQAQDIQSNSEKVLKKTETADDSDNSRDSSSEILNKLKTHVSKVKSVQKKTKRQVTISRGSSNHSDSKTNLVKKERKFQYDDFSPVKEYTPKTDILTDHSDDECKSPHRIPQLLTPRKQKLQSPVYELDDMACSSPPKQRKNCDDSPCQRNEQSEVQTPSRLLLKLKLNSPKRADETTAHNSVTSKQLFSDISEKSISLENDEHSTEGKPEKILNVYQSARKALHSAFPTDMPGREKELTELENFIRTHVENKTSGSLYVSGPPGTGKTASLNIILQQENISSKLQKVYVNCTAIKSPTVIFSRIAKELGIKINGKTEKDYSMGVENYLKKQNGMVLLVLDEIDQLESKNQSVLYTVFEWPSKPNTKLILVGIANALDLTDRTLPRLQARCELKPSLMHFPPYTKQQIVQIFASRLKSAGVLEVFSPVALQMLAAKVAAVSGDVRRALDIGRRVVEVVDRGRKELRPIENLAEGEKPKAVEWKQVADVLNKVYGTSQSLADDADDSFPLQQKIVICALLLMLKKAKNKDVTVGRLHEVYRKVCGKRNILSVDQAEFVGLCSLIETRGIIRVGGRKEPRLQKVHLVWDEGEVAASLKDKQLMSAILQDDACLGKM